MKTSNNSKALIRNRFQNPPLSSVIFFLSRDDVVLCDGKQHANERKVGNGMRWVSQLMEWGTFPLSLKRK